jgi:hypothetical protein
MTVRLQSSAHQLPICDQSPMLDQSDVNPFQSSVNQVPIHPNTMPKTPSEMDVAPWITHLIFNIYTLDFNKFN